ncbi:hypothetical protein C8D99_107105 [Aminivibrio pyruvatiphilus]|uniref:Uncharacterized protein n=1 Tax=Aminivibrio pyruvatiphilus TaxID=1005740 RepID=A0A4R8M7P3_9BACT|nr:hypothetical protein [Aminivibrio pyruvatiphilus]TDY60898.1 hypothetical protein C8D99_107105 [Aminivibrio pyruvatiphilus]
MEPKGKPGRLSGEERTAVSLLMHFCSAVGSANDAEDHGYQDEAGRIREEACTSIRNLAEQHPFLAEVFPGLLRELDTGHILGFGWLGLYRDAEAMMAEKDR